MFNSYGSLPEGTRTNVVLPHNLSTLWYFHHLLGYLQGYTPLNFQAKESDR